MPQTGKVTHCKYQHVPVESIEDLLPLLMYKGETEAQGNGETEAQGNGETEAQGNGETEAQGDQFPYKSSDNFIGAGHLIALIKDAMILHEDFSNEDPIDPDCSQLQPPKAYTTNGERYRKYMLLLKDIYSCLGWKPARWSDAPIINKATFLQKHSQFLVKEFTAAVVYHFPREKAQITTEITENGLIIHRAPYRSVCINELGNILPKMLRRMLGDKDTVLAAIQDNFAQIYRFARNNLQYDFDVQLAAGLKGSAEAATNALKSMSGTTQQQFINYWNHTHIPENINVAELKKQLEKQLESQQWAAEKRLETLNATRHI